MSRLSRPLLVLVALMVLAACSSGGSSADPSTTTASSPSVESPVSNTPSATVVDVATTHWRLPAPVSRPVALAQGSQLVVAGGLTHSGSSTANVTTLDPANGHVVAHSSLATAVHDAAGAALQGRSFVFGGGDSSVGRAVQQLSTTGRARVVANLPQPRADLSSASVTANGTTTAYLVGGYDGSAPDTSVLATMDGTTFHQVATLRVGVRYAAVAAYDGALWVFGGVVNGAPTRTIQRVDLTSGKTTIAGQLPRPLSDASAFVVDNTLLVAGGLTTGNGRMATVWEVSPSPTTGGASPKVGRLKAVAQLPMGASDMGVAVVSHGTSQVAYLVGGEVPAATNQVVTVRLGTTLGAGAGADPSAGWMSSPNVPTHLAPGSDPSVLPGPLLIADKLNNRLLVVDPQGRVRWQFPRPGDLKPGQTFRIPDDAFFSASGRQIIATEEDNYVISVVDIAKHRIVYRYGHPGVPGSAANFVDNPDDAFLFPHGNIVSADIKNCRIIMVHHWAHRTSRILGTTGVCVHNPPHTYGSPNGAFPLPNGNILVTEINGAWVDEITPQGKLVWSTHLPNVAYPSDTNQVRPGVYLTVDYSSPGQVLEFTKTGKVLWRYRPLGAQRLDHPSLGRPLPNGDVLVTDDYNHRVIVIDPKTNKVVWQYGVKGVAGRAPGYLNNPDGLDLPVPNALISSALH